MGKNIEALATSKGEVIYQDDTATIYYITQPENMKDPQVKDNILIWSNFIARQFNPETIDEAARDCLDAEYTWYGADADQGVTGMALRDTACTNIQKILNGFTDFHITSRMFGEGNRVVNFWHMEGIHTGEFSGIPPSGKKIDLRGVVVSLFRNGKRLEDWEFNDDFEVKLKAALESNNRKNA